MQKVSAYATLAAIETALTRRQEYLQIVLKNTETAMKADVMITPDQAALLAEACKVCTAGENALTRAITIATWLNSLA